MSVYVEETKFYVKTLRQKKMTRLTSTKVKRRMLFAINVEMLFAINWQFIWEIKVLFWRNTETRA